VLASSAAPGDPGSGSHTFCQVPPHGAGGAAARRPDVAPTLWLARDRGISAV